ncbi:hypothetical protein H70357_11085 [Paenibacillus sp. FSL H7-0357]|uniref:hypothetical protein n=1 Tax=Paenibacillus sp. FSL H7-0357 TaxID=1536774 RepID=UPI0004F917F3|nr:hypothetical protein [Paenibacillus sp. FSL H7-0357]AIQ17143.1 hypothetical protein H70357_11085 [Paenibacillus sp. FSL H7-0357]
MREFIKTVFQAILYVLIVVGLHLILIYLLEIRIEGWGTGLLEFSFKVYFVPLLLCFINSFLFIRTQRIKYHVTWFLFTTLPNFLLLLFFKGIQTSGDSGDAVVVSIELFPKYQVEMLILLPGSILVIQFILALYYLIKVRKEGKRLKV